MKERLHLANVAKGSIVLEVKRKVIKLDGKNNILKIVRKFLILGYSIQNWKMVALVAIERGTVPVAAVRSLSVVQSEVRLQIAGGGEALLANLLP